MSEGHGSQADKREELLAALLTSGSIQEAARKVGISEKSADRALKDPAFQTELRQARRLCVEHAVSRIAGIAAAAVTVLGLVMTDKKTSGSVRVSAAGKVLDLAMKSLELQDLAARVDELERLAAVAVETE